MDEYRGALERVQMMDFAMHEAALFLDNHPGDKEALGYFKNQQALAGDAKARFEDKFGPLAYQGQQNIEHWQWAEGPWPWECEE